MLKNSRKSLIWFSIKNSAFERLRQTDDLTLHSFWHMFDSELLGIGYTQIQTPAISLAAAFPHLVPKAEEEEVADKDGAF